MANREGQCFLGLHDRKGRPLVVAVNQVAYVVRAIDMRDVGVVMHDGYCIFVVESAKDIIRALGDDVFMVVPENSESEES